jgi:hypothetical protein
MPPYQDTQNYLGVCRHKASGNRDIVCVNSLHTPGDPFQRGQQEDQRHAGRMMLYKIYRSYKCQIGEPLSRIEEDERNWLRRPKLCIKSCRAVIRRTSLHKEVPVQGRSYFAPYV